VAEALVQGVGLDDDRFSSRFETRRGVSGCVPCEETTRDFIAVATRDPKGVGGAGGETRGSMSCNSSDGRFGENGSPEAHILMSGNSQRRRKYLAPNRLESKNSRSWG
jgi:hypothetical protein